MRNLARPNVASNTHRQLRSVTALWRWLIEPITTHSEPERRRANALAIMTLTLLISATLFCGYVFTLAAAAQRGPYLILIGGLILVFVFAYGLNHAGYYSAAAGLIVICSIVGPWYSIALNFPSLRIDLVLPSYTVAGVILSSILLPTRVTVVLAASQLAALILLAHVNLILTDSSWPSLLSFILFISVLSVVSNFISRKDLNQIELQTHQLLKSEARLRELSVRDPLTGLFNRRYMEETLERELQRALRDKGPVGIIMLDVDHFKHFNDTFGHEAGDSVLHEVGACLRGQVRVEDIACRYGGEEFTLIMPAASLVVTQQRAEELREQMKRLRLQYRGQQLSLITISLGVAAFPEHGETGEAVLATADAALYRAKHQGRDQVVVAEAKRA